MAFWDNLPVLGRLFGGGSGQSPAEEAIHDDEDAKSQIRGEVLERLEKAIQKIYAIIRVIERADETHGLGYRLETFGPNLRFLTNGLLQAEHQLQGIRSYCSTYETLSKDVEGYIKQLRAGAQRENQLSVIEQHIIHYTKNMEGILDKIIELLKEFTSDESIDAIQRWQRTSTAPHPLDNMKNQLGTAVKRLLEVKNSVAEIDGLEAEMLAQLDHVTAPEKQPDGQK